MKIGIDARFVGPEGTGLGKYTEKLIENLVKIDKINQYSIFLHKSNWNYLNLKSRNFSKIFTNVPWYSLEEQTNLPKIFNSQNLDLLHVPHFNVPLFYRKKIIVTIHDLIHHEFSQESSTTKPPLIFRGKRFAYKYVIKSAIARSSKIIAPSKYTKSQIIKTFKINSSRIKVIYEAAEEEYFKKAKISKQKLNELLETYNIYSPFLLYVGNAYPHKNLNNLLDAFKLLVHSSQLSVHSSKSVNREQTTDNLGLVIVCPRDIFWHRLNKEIVTNNLSNRVKTLGYIQPEELVNFFKTAKAYIFPTLSEGFGIPGLNAMAAGLPVAASNIPTLKEVYGKNVLFFNPKNPVDISKKISQIVINKKLRADLIKKGYSQAKKYSWIKMAEDTLKVYESTK